MTKSCSFAVCLLLAAAGVAGAQNSADSTEPVGDPISPTVPAGPTDLDHYNCYFAAAPVQQAQALLQDQFDLGASPVITEQVSDLRLVRFCNPVQKSLNGIVTKI